MQKVQFHHRYKLFSKDVRRRYDKRDLFFVTNMKQKKKILPIPNFFVLYIFIVQSFKNEYCDITEILLKVVLNTINQSKMNNR